MKVCILTKLTAILLAILATQYASFGSAGNNLDGVVQSNILYSLQELKQHMPAVDGEFISIIELLEISITQSIGEDELLQIKRWAGEGSASVPNDAPSCPLWLVQSSQAACYNQTGDREMLNSWARSTNAVVSSMALLLLSALPPDEISEAVIMDRFVEYLRPNQAVADYGLMCMGIAQAIAAYHGMKIFEEVQIILADRLISDTMAYSMIVCLADEKYREKNVLKKMAMTLFLRLQSPGDLSRIVNQGEQIPEATMREMLHAKIILLESQMKALCQP